MTEAAAASVDDDGHLAPCPADFNFAAYALDGAGAPDARIALVHAGASRARRLSYGELRDRVRRTAGAFRARGLVAGDRVLLRLGNSLDFPMVFLGAVWAGLVPTPTAEGLTEAELGPIGRALRPALTVARPGATLPPDDPAPVIGVDDLDGASLDEPDLGDPERPGFVVFTSGTGGTPKGVVHAHRAIWARRSMVAGWTGLTAADRMMHAGAFNWTYTLGTGLLDPWTLGATAIVPQPDTTPAQLALLMARHDATVFAAVPGVYRRLLRDPLPALPRLRHGLSAGEALPPTVRAAWADATGTPIFEAFGQSECSTFISGGPGRPAPEGAVGYAQPGRTVAVLDQDGQPAPRGTMGAFAIAADDPGLMLGYLTEAGLTPPTPPWVPTGDLMTMAADGALIYGGRADDVITAGGYRIAPAEIEAVLTAHPGVTDAAAVGISPRADTTLVAAAVTGDDVPPDAELARHCAERLAGYKVPRLFARLPELPRGPNGKILRRVVRDRLNHA